MTLEELLVKIKVENKQAVKGLNDAKKSAEQAEGQFNKLRNGLKTLRAQMKAKTDNAYAKEVAKGYRDAQKSLDSLLKKQEAMKRHNIASPQYKKLTSDIAKAERALDELVERQVAWAESGIDPNSSPFRALDEQIESARARLDLLYEKQKDMASNGSTVAEANEWKKIQERIAEARSEVARYEKILAGIGAGNPVVQRISSIISSVRRAGAGIKNFGRKSVSALKGVVSWIGKMGRGFGTVLSKIPLLNNLTKKMKGMKRGLFFGLGLKSMLRMGLAGFLIYKGLSMAKQGFENLAKYSGQTNSDISMLMSSLATLKNSLATAFAPILTAVAPALNSLIQLLVKATTAVAHFTAAFTGKSTVVVAKQQTVDYASSLSDATDATDSANESAKEYQKTLLGFDQMNILNAPDKSSGSGGSGGGGGAGAGDMFETVEVSNGAKSLVDKIKQAWKEADFTDIGLEIGNKIAGMLDKIPWKKIKDTAYKIGKSIATGFNGLNDSKFWKSLGKALGESVNTVVKSIKGFVDNFNWKKAGKAFAKGINTFFSTVNWKDIGKTVSKGVKGVLDTLTSMFSTIDWKKAGKNLVSTITSVDWAGIIVRGIKAVGSLASGILNFIQGAFEEAFSAVANWIKSGEAWKDIKNVGKAVINVGVNLVGDAWNAIKTAVTGIWDIVKSIASFLGAGKNGSGDSVPANNPAHYQGHDWQGTDMTQTVTVDAKQTKNFADTYQKFIAIKNGTATKTIGVNRSSNFLEAFKQYTGIVTNKATKKIGTERSSNFLEAFRQYTGIKDKTATVTFKGKLGGNLRSVVVAMSQLATGGLYKNGRWQPVTMAASGGAFNTGQMFIAREAGPELVGRIGSGTAVMNNDQIVASVAKGVYEAVLSAMSVSDSDKSVNVYLQGDAGRLFKVVQNQANDYMNATGMAPFPV